MFDHLKSAVSEIQTMHCSTMQIISLLLLVFAEKCCEAVMLTQAVLLNDSLTPSCDFQLVNVSASLLTTIIFSSLYLIIYLFMFYVHVSADGHVPFASNPVCRQLFQCTEELDLIMLRK